MSKFSKNKNKKELPEISTASLPDIVFMLLFFFMVATVMRENTLMVKNKLPYADQVEKLQKKNLVMYIYAGQPSDGYRAQYGTEARIQLNDKFADVSEIRQFIIQERNSKNESQQKDLTTSLKVDKDANMGLVGDIKHELREVEAYRINYTTRNGKAEQNIRR